MKTIISIIFLALVFSCQGEKNEQSKIIQKTKIDSITDLNELRKFAQKADSTLSDFWYLSPNLYKQVLDSTSKLKRELDSLFSNSDFIKADFDNNGYTDIILTGEMYFRYHIIALMSYGNNQYSTIPISLRDIGARFPVYPKLIHINKNPAIELYAKDSYFDGQENQIVKKTLIYKYNTFIEYNEHPKNHQITKIEFSRDGCFGTCPVFDLILQLDSESIFRAKFFNFSKDRDIDFQKEEGNFETMINENDFKEICQIINYINIKSLNDYYSVTWTCDEDSTLKVYFKDGSSKTIHDYGMIGTHGLKLLYEKLSELRFNQNWKKI